MNIIESTLYALPGWLRKYRWPVLSLYLVLLVLAFLGMDKIWKDDSLKSWFGKDSDIFKNQQKFERYFGGNEDVYIVYEAKDGDIFSEASLAALSRLHNKLAGFAVDVQKNPDSPLSHTREVQSLINIQVTKVEGDNLQVYEFIGKQLPDSKEKRELLKETALKNPELVLNFVSRDAQYGAVSIQTNFGDVMLYQNRDTRSDVDSFSVDLEYEAEDSAINPETFEETPRDYDMYYSYMQEIRAKVKEANVDGELNVYYAGLPELIAFQTEVLDPEMSIIFLGIFVFMLAILGWIFRHPSAVLWTMIVLIVTVFFTMGIIGWTGVPTSSLSDPMILMIVLISVSDVVHFIASYKHHRLIGMPHEESLSNAFAKSGWSCFLTTFTTMIGFGSLWLVKSTVPVSNFGYFCAVGLLLAYVVSVTLMPILLDIWAPSYKPLKDSTSDIKDPDVAINSSTDVPKQFHFGQGVFNLTNNYSAVIIGVFLLVITAIGIGMKDIVVDTNTLESFDESTYLRKAFEVADKNMAGTQNIDFMVNLKESDSVGDLDVLQRIEDFQQRMNKEFPTLIATSVSVVDLIKRINQQMHQDDPAYFRLPDTNTEVNQLLFLFNSASPEERRRLISDDFDATRISFNVRNSGSTGYVELIARANQWSKEIFNPLKSKYANMEIITSGGVVTFMHLFDLMTKSEVNSFLVTLALIGITFFFVFQSFTLGFLALIAATFPIILTFGLMGWLGIPLNPTTMIIAPIILGLATDDSIHFINKLRGLLPKTENVTVAVWETLRQLAPALTFTTLVLVGGMLSLLYSSDSSFQAFGYLGALALMCALFVDLLFIPSVCLLYAKFRAAPQADPEPAN